MEVVAAAVAEPCARTWRRGKEGGGRAEAGAGHAHARGESGAVGGACWRAHTRAAMAAARGGRVEKKMGRKKAGAGPRGSERKERRSDGRLIQIQRPRTCEVKREGEGDENGREKSREGEKAAALNKVLETRRFLAFLVLGGFFLS